MRGSSACTWEDVTVSVDTVNNVINGKTSSLSPFVVGEATGSSGVGFGTNVLLALAGSLILSSLLLICSRRAPASIDS